MNGDEEGNAANFKVEGARDFRAWERRGEENESQNGRGAEYSLPHDPPHTQLKCGPYPRGSATSINTLGRMVNIWGTTLNIIFSVIWYLISPWPLYIWHFLWIRLQILSWMMDEFIHWPKPSLLLSSTCDELLSWMIKIWMKSPLSKW